MITKKLGIAAASLAAVGIVGAGLLTNTGLAQAETASPSPSSSASASGSATPGERGPGGKAGKGGHAHTAATADEAAKVTAAVKAKDAAVTITEVVKDPDGSFDARGTKDGATVQVEVSADLQTVEVREGGRGGGPGGGKGGKGAVAHTEASADETSKVTAAIAAKDSAVTVEKVYKDADGSFHAHATKAGEQVRVKVSADLATVEVRTAPTKAAHTEASADETSKVTAAITAKDSAVTVEKVYKNTDGSFHAHGTKGDQKVRVTVSSDLQTVEVSQGR